MRSTRPIGDETIIESPATSLARLLLSLLLVLLVMLFPGHPEGFVVSSLMRFPLELPVLVLLLVFFNSFAGRWLCATLVALMGILLLLRLADLGSYLAFNRRFSPLLEFHLIADGWNLASTSIGPVEAGLITVAAMLSLIALLWLMYRCLRCISQVNGRMRMFLVTGCLVLGVTGMAALAAEKAYQYNSPIEAEIIPEISDRIGAVSKSIVDQRAFIRQLQTDDVLDEQVPTFRALAGRDVILIFVESYGRGYLDAERFAAQASTRLNSVEQTLQDAELSVRSGWLTSPIRGGRSWLAHATLQSGMEISNQARFDRLITTDRQSLSRLFSQAGWRSVGLMPAIQFDWPEGVWYGYDDLRVSQQMNYNGERFGYVTMPDQYTLAHFETAIRQPTDQPIMASLALLSTHAPWTPLPEKVDWDAIGDGSIFDGTRRFGERVNWKYRDKVQQMYASSFDYTLDILAEYAARYADDALIIIVGDHQPPPIINGWGKSADVPIHIIGNDTDLLDRLPAQYWVDGMQPDETVQSQPMSSLRKTMASLFEQP